MCITRKQLGRPCTYSGGWRGWLLGTVRQACTAWGHGAPTSSALGLGRAAGGRVRAQVPILAACGGACVGIKPSHAAVCSRVCCLAGHRWPLWCRSITAALQADPQWPPCTAAGRPMPKVPPPVGREGGASAWARKGLQTRSPAPCGASAPVRVALHAGRSSPTDLLAQGTMGISRTTKITHEARHCCRASRSVPLAGPGGSRADGRIRRRAVRQRPALLTFLPVRRERLERPTPRFVAWCSIQLSQRRRLSGQGSNLHIPRSKHGALPLGYPTRGCWMGLEPTTTASTRRRSAH